MREPRAVRLMKFFIFAVVALSIIAAGFGEAVLHLWNWLMPAIFGLHTIDYWQALGLLGLCWILFGGQRGWMGPGVRLQRRRMRERWQQLTQEQREKIRATMRERCGFEKPASEQKA